MFCYLHGCAFLPNIKHFFGIYKAFLLFLFFFFCYVFAFFFLVSKINHFLAYTSCIIKTISPHHIIWFEFCECSIILTPIHLSHPFHPTVRCYWPTFWLWSVPFRWRGDSGSPCTCTISWRNSRSRGRQGSQCRIRWRWEENSQTNKHTNKNIFSNNGGDPKCKLYYIFL